MQSTSDNRGKKKLYSPNKNPIRIADYDYSPPGAYFVTVCTANLEKLFWDIVGADINGSRFYETVGFPANWQTHLAEILL